MRLHNGTAGDLETVRTLLTVLALATSLAACTPAPEKTPPGFDISAVPQTGDTRFTRDVLDSEQPVLVEFYATWCGPCRRMEPVVAEIAERYRDKVKVLRVDIDQNPALAEHYRVDAIPRVMLFRSGDLVQDILGSTTTKQLGHALDRTLASRRGETL